MAASDYPRFIVEADAFRDVAYNLRELAHFLETGEVVTGGDGEKNISGIAIAMNEIAYRLRMHVNDVEAGTDRVTEGINGIPAKVDEAVDEAITEADIPGQVSDAIEAEDIPGQVQDGITNSETVTDAVEAAAVVAVDAEVLARELVETTDERLPEKAYSDELSIWISDEEGNTSWLQADTEGNPSTYVIDTLRPLLGLDSLQVNAGKTFAIVDEEGNSLPDLIFEEDGSLTVDSAQRIVQRGMTPENRRLMRKATRVYAFGDSLTAADWCRYAQSHTGVWFSHRGVGGQATHDIAVRQGGVAISFELNGVTAITGNGVDTPLTKLLPASGFRSYAEGPVWSWTGLLGPVAGVLYHNLDLNTWYFRSNSGTSSVTPPSAKATFIATADDNTRDHAQVLWVGRNNPSSTAIIDAVHAMINHVEYGRPILVVGVTAITGNTGDLNNLRTINAAVATTLHPDDYLDLQVALATTDALTRVGLTPTSQDLADIAAGFIPRQILSGDLLHFTSDGYNAIGQIIGETMQTRGKI